jgi:predicted ATPase/class 3 adenylate cyclase
MIESAGNAERDAGAWRAAPAGAGPLPSGTVTFLYTDIEGSTPLWEREPAAMQQAQERHDAILHPAIAAGGGRVYKVIGDAFQAAFAVAGDAVRAAAAAQRALAAESWPTSRPLRVRMGIHSGHAIAEERDYLTTHTLNRVARIMAAGHGGQILLSEAVVELLRDDMPAGLSLREMGLHQMKGLAQPERLYQVAAPDLPASFPPLNTLSTGANNLPAQLTTFVGRERELSEVAALLAECRLVTLAGAGGAGKTRLAIQAARQLQGAFPHGIWLVELAPLADPLLVPQAALAVLGLQEDGQRTPLQILIDYLQPKTLLLLLDNCEHLIAACAELSDALLRACPQLRILASSREALGVAGEAAYRVPSLAAPAAEEMALEELASLDAVRLFVERAAAARPGFTLNEQNAAAVAQICRRLDGIPLAIELAAARVKVLAPEQIAARLDDRFRLLTGGSRTALPRQQTLRALIDWSYSLLAPEEQQLLRRLAVFTGGWTLEAAETVCAGEGIEPYDVLDLLARLVDKSLVLLVEEEGAVRYRRLETIRQYAREKFAESDEAATVRDRHLAYIVAFCEQADAGLQLVDAPSSWRLLGQEVDNIRAALEWALPRAPESALRICGALRHFWSMSGYGVEGERWTNLALSAVENAPAPGGEAERKQRQRYQARALVALAWCYVAIGRSTQGVQASEQAIALYRQTEPVEPIELALALLVLGQAHFFLGNNEVSRTALEESAALARASRATFAEVFALSIISRVRAVLDDDLSGAEAIAGEALRRADQGEMAFLGTMLTYNLGLIALGQGDFTAARRHFEEGRERAIEQKARLNVLMAESELAHLDRTLGDYEAALARYRETITGFRDAGQRGAVAHQLECFGFIALAQGQPERAVRLWAAAAALREQVGAPMMPQEQAEYQAQRALAQEQLGAVAFAAIWDAGRQLTAEQAIREAVEG